MAFWKNKHKYTDTQIVEAYQKPDAKIQQSWFDSCRTQFLKGSSGYGLTDYQRDDLFQESFILLWDKIKSRQIHVEGKCVFVISKKGDNPLPDLMGYFMRIVKNKYFELLRDGNIIRPSDAEPMPSEEELFDLLYWDEDAEVAKDRIVKQCLQTMPKSCREILIMFYYEKKSLEDILALRPEGSSYDALKTRKSKCMGTLKKKISDSFAKAGLR